MRRRPRAAVPRGWAPGAMAAPGARARGAGVGLRAALALLALVGCASRGGHLAAEAGEGVAVAPAAALAFNERADAFYQRLIRRRVNALETFNDPQLHQHFRSRDRFLDYYADLAAALDDANFEKSRPESVQVEEFLFDTPTTVRVQVLFVGKDDRPLRPDRTRLLRVDRWERAEDNWWITPGKL